MEMGQRPMLDLIARMAGGIERLDRGGGHHHAVVAVAEVGDGVHDAYVGAHADYRDLLRLGGPKALLEIGLEEARVAAFTDKRGLMQQRLELRNDLRLDRPPYAVHREDLELTVVRVVRVGQEDQVIACLPAIPDDLADARDGGIAAR